MIPDVQAVVTELDEHRAKFEAFCRSLSPEELSRPVPRSTWQVRDFIAHLSTIDGPVGEMFRTIHEGGDPGLRSGDGERFDVDQWNERQVQRLRGKSVEEILAVAAESRAVLHGTMAQLTEADVQKNIKFAGDSRRAPAEFPLLTYLRGWCKHDPMHAVDMMRAMPERMTPELEQWFADPVIQGYQRSMNPPEK